MILDRLIIGATRFLIGGRAAWVGCKPTPKQRIYFANHSSNLDTVVIWAALPPTLRARTRPAAAADYWDRTRARRHLARDVLGAVLVDRGAGRDALREVEDALRAGNSIIIFPEGTRGHDAIPAAFKSGLFHLAAAFPQAELIPVYLHNLNRAMPKGVWLPVPVSASVLFGAPVEREPAEDKAAFLTRARGAMLDLARTVLPEAPGV